MLTKWFLHINVQLCQMIKIRLNKSKSQQINCNPSVFSPTTDLGLLGVAYDDFGPFTVMGQILQEPIINITQL